MVDFIDKSYKNGLNSWIIVMVTITGFFRDTSEMSSLQFCHMQQTD